MVVVYLLIFCPGDSLRQNTRVDGHSHFQGFFPIQRLNLGLLIAGILYTFEPPYCLTNLLSLTTRNGWAKNSRSLQWVYVYHSQARLMHFLGNRLLSPFAFWPDGC